MKTQNISQHTSIVYTTIIRDIPDYQQKLIACALNAITQIT